MVDDKYIQGLLLQKSTKNKGFELLLSKYKERLYWHVRNMVLIHEDADDLVQNVWIKVFRFIDDFNGKSSLYTWLYRIATNETLNFLNKKKRLSPINQNYSGHLSASLVADPYFEGDKIEQLLLEEIANLPDKQRQVFLLKYYEKLDYKSISEITGTSVGTLKAQFHSATNKIQSQLIKTAVDR